MLFCLGNRGELFLSYSKLGSGIYGLSSEEEAKSDPRSPSDSNLLSGLRPISST